MDGELNGIGQILEVVERYIDSMDGFNRLYSKDACPQTVSSLADIARSPSCLNEISSQDDIVNHYENPVGQHICELRKVVELVRDTLLLLSRDDPYYDPYSQSVVDTFSSLNFKLGDVSADLAADLLGTLGLGSMAGENQEDYAKAFHDHDKIYSRLTFTSNPELTAYNLTQIGQIAVSTDYLPDGKDYSNPDDNPEYSQTDVQTYTLSAATVANNIPAKPMIGTLRFIGSQSMANIVSKYGLTMTDDGLQVNPYDSDGNIRTDYDGWIFPNGISIDNIGNQLSDAAEFFGQSGSIVPPNLNGFFKADPDSLNTSVPDYSVQTYQLGVKPHQHTINLNIDNFNLSVTPISEISTSVFAGSGDYKYGTYNNKPVVNTHAGLKADSDHAEYDISYEQSQSLNIGLNMSINPAGNIEEAYPKHNIIPIMMYIGGELNSYYME